MDQEKKNALNKTFEAFQETCLSGIPNPHYEQWIYPKIMGFGTAVDEIIEGIDQFDTLLKNQNSQLVGMKSSWQITPIYRKFSDDENTAIFADDVDLKISNDKENIVMNLRLTTIFSFSEERWQVIHWHGSKPEMVENETDAWGVDAYKQKAEELQKLVDEQTVDLKEKNRELEIEAGLERVRARSMAMHSSEDMGACILKMFTELTALGVDERTRFGIGILNHENEENQLWTARKNGDEIKMHIGKIDMKSHPLLKKARKAWKEKIPFHKYLLKGADLKAYYRMLNGAPDYKIDIPLDELPKKEVQHCFIFEYGFFYAFSPEEFDKEIIRIGQRFTSQFEQTYRRYLDLQKAEAQTREAQIEAGLERVRASAMAMRHSDDLVSCTKILFDQLEKLDLTMERSGIGVFDPETRDCQLYTTVLNPEGKKELSLGVTSLTIHPMLIQTFEAWERQEALSYTLEGEDLKNYYEIVSHSEFILSEEVLEKSSALPREFYHYSPFSAGGLYFFSDIEPKEEDKRILQRFAEVFDLTYTRFLDLQKAEKQAREAQIETTLERVRGRALAMHATEELSQVIMEFYQDLESLDIHLDRGMLAVVDSKTEDITWWMAGKEELISDRGLITKKNDHQFHQTFINLWKKKEKKWSYTLEGEEKKDWDEYAFSETEWAQVPKPIQENMKSLPKINLFGSSAAFGSLLVSSVEDLSEEQQELINRFTTSFNQTFTRFLDLQKVEEQAREAKIEAALERVRSASMAMHRSEDLEKVVEVTFNELRSLQLPIDGCQLLTFEDQSKNFHFWSATPDMIYPNRVNIPCFDHPIFTKFWEARDNGDTFTSFDLTKEETLGFYNHLYEHTNLGEIITKERWKRIQSIQYGYRTSWGIQKNTGLWIFNFSNHHFTPDENSVILRFSRVFEQTYTRFLDLQKAEEQAKEAKIEAALEKVRARTMGMQHSDELPEAANILFTEVQNLGIPAWSCGYCILQEDKRSSTCIMSSEGTLQKPFLLPHHGEASFDEWGDFVTSEEMFFVQELGGEAIESHYGFMKSLPDLKLTFQELEEAGLTLPSYQINHLCKFSNGFLLFITYEKVPDAHSIFKRFTRVFEQTYTRFLDLKKAEEQAQEAKVELSLERIRAQVTAMRESEELLEIVVSMRKEFVSLGHEAHYFWHMRWLPKTYAKAMTSGDGTQIGMVMTLPRHIHGDIPAVAEWEKSKDPTHILAMDVDLAVEYIDKMIKLGDFERVDPQSPTLDDIRQIGGLTFVMARTTHGEIGYSLPGKVEHPPQESIDTLTRFAGVFDLAYRRFEDLLTAEKQSRKAKIELALERVRARAMAMQEPEELVEVAQVLREEMGLLGVEELETSSIYINQEDQITAQCWYSIKDIRDGSKKYVADHFDLNYTETWVGSQMLAFYKSEEPNTSILMRGEHRIEWINYCAKRTKKLDGFYGNEIPERTYHLTKFSNGAIGAATPGEISPESWELLQRAATVFSLAYSRFLDLSQARDDLKKLKRAKAKAEKALKDLKSAQEQLIQQEKLASLGQLTAGIAHEIKNPLNFVNNFSELSGELIDEVFEELENVDDSEAKEEIVAILEDVKSNLVKVNEHGSRADGIVKSMLQHSRASGSKEESKDFNGLVKEFVNLSFHGMRAGKNPINVDIQLDLDPDVQEVKLITEDFSRVILNICNNAFDAMRELLNEESHDYLASLEVSTKALKGAIELRIKDNGPGVPDDIKDQILQPFFTTKKGTEGTGLGLSITHDIIKAHGGELEVKSEKGKGAEFIIHLPIH